jgi:hypothetical protein
MSFADDLFTEAALPALQEFAGDPAAATLTTRGGDESGPFDAILEHEQTQRIEGDAGRVLEHSRLAKFPYHADLPFWTGGNLLGLIVTIAGVDWMVDLVENVSPSLATVKLVRRATSEVSRPGYRKR